MKIELMTGNEAIARGAYEYGITVAAAYPGTPSTEILENLSKYPGVKSQWSPNEKVALEVGIGASFGGARVIVTMKHVGVNVAADPLFTLAYTGVNGGLILVSADDPGMHSSQNEQDNRYYAKFNQIPMLEPSDSQEAKDFIGLALEISEKFDTPILYRTTTRVSHSQGLVKLGDKQDIPLRQYVKNPQKYVMVPAHARGRHVVVDERRKSLEAYAENCPVNKTEMGSTKIGIITSGISYQYVKEALPEASILKLGLTYPLPQNLIREFASKVERLYVIEELEPFLEEQIKALGIEVAGKELFSRLGELNPVIISEKITGTKVKKEMVTNNIPVPVRPPVMCPGCPHRGVFYTLNNLKLVVSGDIGCYTLGAMPPLEAIDTCVCMGASIGGALGMERANPDLKGRVVAVIGDSTFLHSGVTGLMDVVYNKGTTTTIILDNSITAMTGHQDNPSTGKTLMKEPAPQVDLVKLAEALGVKRVEVVDPFDLGKVKEILKNEAAAEEPSVVIAKRPCALLIKEKETPLAIAEETCIGCKSCLKLGCPALSYDKVSKKVAIDFALCTGCGLCAQVCKVGAIVKVGEGVA